MLASAVRTYLNRYGVAAGKATVVVTNNDSAYHTALELHAAGQTLAAIVDTRASVDGALQQAAISKGISLLRGYTIKNVQGRRAVKAVQLAEHLGGG